MHNASSTSTGRIIIDTPSINIEAPSHIEVDKPYAIEIKANRLTGGGVQQVSIADATVFSFYLATTSSDGTWLLDIPKTTDPAHNYSAVFTTAARLSMEHSVKIIPFSFDEKRK